MSEELPPLPGRLAPGSPLAGYRCEEEIGRGGMAVVYRAYDDHLDRRVALKVLAPDLARDEVFRARFIQESRIAAAAEHPNIIPVFSAGEADGVLYIAMRYVPDGDVRTLIDRVGPLPAARGCALIAQAASALDAAHARGLVHRDVKPTNMLLEISPRTSRPDHLYLSDFGLAKPSAAATGLTATGQFFGTVDYVAPEQIQGDPLDGRTDQYALACGAFEMLSGSPPFRRENGMAVISAQLSEPPPSLSARVPGLPAAADRVIAKALAKSPADRYDRCLDFAEALLAACRLEATGGASVAGVPYSPTRAAGPVTPATAADAGRPGPVQAPSASPGYPPAGASYPAAGGGYPSAGPGYSPAGVGYPSAGAGYPATGAGFPAAGAGFPPPPPAGFPPQPPIRTGFPPPAAEPDPDTLRWSGQPDPGYRGGGGRRRSRGAFTAGLVAALLVLFFAAAGVTYLVLHKTRGTGPGAAGSGAPASSSAPGVPASSGPTAPASSSTLPAPPSPPPPGVLAATVRAYYSAINHHRYARAWRLGGRNTGETYHAYISGFAGTAHDTVTIQSVSGDVVTGQLVAQQTNGTVKTYQGSYTVEGGVITQFSVQQVS
jgi:tRNA A-37 threonylcarbamoyl transferase component Bud32